MTSYFLPTHVHFCSRGDSLVFLDLKRDDYTLLEGTEGDAFKRIAGIRPGQGCDIASAVARLVGEGLLTTNPTLGRPIAATHVELAIEQLLDGEPPSNRIGIAQFIRFASACTSAAVQLRWSSIETIVTKLRERKQSHADHTRQDIGEVRRLVAAFLKLRSIFPVNYLCLYDSLALLEFLASYRIFPTWVFGVTLEPWGAHCWVQDAGLVYNEGIEEAANYTPILAI